MNGELYPRGVVAGLYLPRKEGRRGLISIEDCVESTRVDIDFYVDISEESLLKETFLKAVRVTAI